MTLAKKCDRCGAFHNNYNEAQNSKKNQCDYDFEHR